ncbi:hypothetical protein OG802_15895 [Streptomyces sp. NBC_00704]|uniref:hypothetical protein n=1 Tax=Streptomyces sp. NBC_00704 TaxID=2975809 RepID=UPI002E334BB7|nr:hypothetical protein [Streptomyces sp. NBC_00704]
MSRLMINGNFTVGVTVGDKAMVTARTTYLVTKPAGLSASSIETRPLFYRGETLGARSEIIRGDHPGVCTAASATLLRCVAMMQFRPTPSAGHTDLKNSQTGTWKEGGLIVVRNAAGVGRTTWQGDLGFAYLLRRSKITILVRPRSVRKGQTVLIAGKFSRADWDRGGYTGYPAQPVPLEFRKKGTRNFGVVARITTSASGTVAVAHKPPADGFYRFYRWGSTTTSGYVTAPVLVDVK